MRTSRRTTYHIVTTKQSILVIGLSGRTCWLFSFMCSRSNIDNKKSILALGLSGRTCCSLPCARDRHQPGHHCASCDFVSHRLVYSLTIVAQHLFVLVQQWLKSTVYKRMMISHVSRDGDWVHVDLEEHRAEQQVRPERRSSASMSSNKSTKLHTHQPPWSTYRATHPAV